MPKQQTTIQELNGTYIETNTGPINVSYNNQKKDSAIRKFLNLLLESNHINDETFKAQIAFDINEKIAQNNVTDHWLEIINDEYFNYENAISHILNQDNTNGIPKKSIFVSIIGDYYREAKVKLNLFSASIEKIAENSTIILDETVNLYIDFLKENGENTEESDRYLLKILIVYGFMECKVLEKPIMKIAL